MLYKRGRENDGQSQGGTGRQGDRGMEGVAKATLKKVIRKNRNCL